MYKLNPECYKLKLTFYIHHSIFKTLSFGFDTNQTKGVVIVDVRKTSKESIVKIGENIIPLTDDILNELIDKINQAKINPETSIYDGLRKHEGFHPHWLIESEYDIVQFFNDFKLINISKFAEYCGLNPSQMRKYAVGIQKPPIKKMEIIQRKINTLIKHLSNVKFQ